MVGLHAGDDAELLEARDVGGIDDLRVLDAIAGSLVEHARLRNASRAIGSGLVADGVEAELESGGGAFDGHFVELVLRVLRKAGVVGVVGVRRFHRGGARAERAIHEAFEHAGVEQRIVDVVVSAVRFNSSRDL